jgi:hypothetical protein
MANFNIAQLQSYIKEKRQEYVTLSQPGYEVMFYSRFNLDTEIIPFIQGQTNLTGAGANYQPNVGGVSIPSMSNVTPNVILSSDIDRNSDVTNVVSIRTNTSVVAGEVGSAELVLINSDSISYFLPTIGSYGKNAAIVGPDTTGSTDYDYSEGVNVNQERIGVMDTVIIKLKNRNVQGGYDKDVVFRGVIQNISRTSSPNDGNYLTITLADFSEWMSKITALPLNAFSTISFSITGRELVSNLVKYTNRLYTGDWAFLGSNLRQAFSSSSAPSAVSVALNQVAKVAKSVSDTTTYGVSAIASASGTLPGGNDINTSIVAATPPIATSEQAALALSTSSNHAMAVPPFIYLQFSNTDTNASVFEDVQGTVSQAFNQIQKFLNISTSSSTDDSNSPDNAKNNTTGQNAQNTNDVSNPSSVFNQLNATETSLFTNLIQKGIFKLTPEDSKTIQYYQTTFTQYYDDKETNQFGTTLNNAANTVKNLQQYAWVLSDIYLEPGAISFENERPWAVAQKAANHALRECFFDFAPKLSSLAQTPYDSALVSEIYRTANSNPVNAANSNPNTKGLTTLDDIHPNIGILKYRLSPCMIPYVEDDNYQGTQEIFQWSISDDDVIKYQTFENSESLFTACFGFGSALDATSVTQDFKAIVSGQYRAGGLAFAHSADPQIERRVGYRFMTESDNLIKIPFLMYLTSYITLLQSKMNMFSASVSVIGNPKYKPGSIIRLLGRNTDYYCTKVQNSWSLTEGYKTDLYLQYGHTSGISPAPLTGGSTYDNIAANNTCETNVSAIEVPFKLDRNKQIGGIYVLCLISAFWEFMTCNASTDAALQALSPDVQKGAKKTEAVSDWLTLYNATPGTLIKGGFSVVNNPLKNPNFPSFTVASQIGNIQSAIQNVGLDKFFVTPNFIINLLFEESAASSTGGICIDAINEKYDGGTSCFMFTETDPTQPTLQELLHSQVYLQRFYNTFGLTPQEAVSDWNKCLSAGTAFLAGKFRQFYKTSNYDSTKFLYTLAAYNGSEGSLRYPSMVLGPAQVQNILNGTQHPGKNLASGSYIVGMSPTCTIQIPGLSQWPYKVYGPIGERLDAYKAYHSNTTDSDAKKVLLSFNSGMQEAINYISTLLKKYGDNTKTLKGAGVNGTPGASVNPNNVIDKVVAAWYSNENLSSLTANDANKLQATIMAITQKYQRCLNCSGVVGNPTNSKNMPLLNSTGGSNYSRRTYNAMLQFRASHQAKDSTIGVFGAPAGEECAACVSAILQLAGLPTYQPQVIVPNTAQMLALGYQIVDVSQAVPGDIITIGSGHHVGIYTGNGEMISNSSTPNSFTWGPAPISYCDSSQFYSNPGHIIYHHP